jgi:cytochrome c
MNRFTVSWRQIGVALVLCLGLVGAGAAQAAATSEEKLLEIGQRIYTQGVLSDGTELIGMRSGNTTVSGGAAACVNCHRSSGMGQVEGDIAIPPIAGGFLFANPGDKPVATMDSHVRKFFNQAHEPYTEASLTKAILQGVNNQGRTMNVAMPRFKLNAMEVQALMAYLKQLSAQWSPGVTSNNIRFATVITPDVDPARRKVV